jgi:hypothetical protein
VGSAATYFSTNQPTKFTAVITYTDGGKNSYSETIPHDLSIYQDLPHSLDRE